MNFKAYVYFAVVTACGVGKVFTMEMINNFQHFFPSAQQSALSTGRPFDPRFGTNTFLNLEEEIDSPVLPKPKDNENLTENANNFLHNRSLISSPIQTLFESRNEGVRWTQTTFFHPTSFPQQPTENVSVCLKRPGSSSYPEAKRFTKDLNDEAIDFTMLMELPAECFQDDEEAENHQPSIISQSPSENLSRPLFRNKTHEQLFKGQLEMVNTFIIGLRGSSSLELSDKSSQFLDLLIQKGSEVFPQIRILTIADGPRMKHQSIFKKMYGILINLLPNLESIYLYGNTKLQNVLSKIDIKKKSSPLTKLYYCISSIKLKSLYHFMYNFPNVHIFLNSKLHGKVFRRINHLEPKQKSIIAKYIPYFKQNMERISILNMLDNKVKNRNKITLS